MRADLRVVGVANQILPAHRPLLPLGALAQQRSLEPAAGPRQHQPQQERPAALFPRPWPHAGLVATRLDRIALSCAVLHGGAVLPAGNFRRQSIAGRHLSCRPAPEGAPEAGPATGGVAGFIGLMASSRYTPSLRKLSAVSRSNLIPSSVIPNVAISVAVSVRFGTFGTCQVWNTV